MDDEYFGVSAKNILGISSNVPGFSSVFGAHLPVATADNFSRCAVKMRFVVAKGKRHAREMACEHEKSMGKYQYFRGGVQADSISYSRSLFLDHVFNFQVKDIIKNEPTFTVNNAYFKLIKFNIQNIQSCHTINSDIACIMLLKNKYAPIYCAAIKSKDRTTLIFGPPNIGKSLCAIKMCADLNCSFIAEDVAITDGINVYSVPSTTSMRFNPNSSSRLKRDAFEKIPFLDLIPGGRFGSVGDLLKQNEICEQAAITHLIFLGYGERDHVVSINKKDALQKIMNLNRFLFRYEKSPILNAYEYFNPKLDLEGTREAEKKIVFDMVANAKVHVEIYAKDPRRYSPLLADIISATSGPQK